MKRRTQNMGIISLCDVYDVDYNHPTESSVFGIRTVQPLRVGFNVEVPQMMP